MQGSFGTWLSRYKGPNARIKNLSVWFKGEIRKTGERASGFKTSDAVYKELIGWGPQDPKVRRLLHLCDLVRAGQLVDLPTRFVVSEEAHLAVENLQMKSLLESSAS